MKRQRQESFFWTSYSDLMTSLFFVMLVLFVLVIVLLSKQLATAEQHRKEAEKRRAATEQQLNKIKQIEDAVKTIDPQYFVYDSVFKRHTLKNITISFRRGSADIEDIPSGDLHKLYEVGKSINTFVEKAAQTNPDIKYLVIVEGQSSKDDYRFNYELSYERALALVQYWQRCGISLNNRHCEVIISGSGQASPFRNYPDIPGNASNQRFVIHIIPPTGIIDDEPTADKDINNLYPPPGMAFPIGDDTMSTQNDSYFRARHATIVGVQNLIRTPK